jgi:outer membrane receptor protein involved in Fe transport
MSRTVNKAIGVSVLAIAWAASAAPALAQTSDGEQVSDRDTIVVTAQKKAENVQDVPIAITALNTAALEAARVEDSKDLQFNAPNVTFSANRNITIRGVGSAPYGGTGDTNIGALVNGVFPRSGSSFSSAPSSISI